MYLLRTCNRIHWLWEILEIRGYRACDLDVSRTPTDSNQSRLPPSAKEPSTQVEEVAILPGRLSHIFRTTEATLQRANFSKTSAFFFPLQDVDLLIFFFELPRVLYRTYQRPYSFWHAEPPHDSRSKLCCFLRQVSLKFVKRKTITLQTP